MRIVIPPLGRKKRKKRKKSKKRKKRKKHKLGKKLTLTPYYPLSVEVISEFSIFSTSKASESMGFN
jgi:hypothetical protein